MLRSLKNDLQESAASIRERKNPLERLGGLPPAPRTKLDVYREGSTSFGDAKKKREAAAMGLEYKGWGIYKGRDGKHWKWSKGEYVPVEKGELEGKKSAMYDKPAEKPAEKKPDIGAAGGRGTEPPSRKSDAESEDEAQWFSQTRKFEGQVPQGPAWNYPPAGTAAAKGNKQAMIEWNKTLDKHKDSIFRYPDKSKQWPAAVIIYRRHMDKYNRLNPDKTISMYQKEDYAAQEFFYNTLIEESGLNVEAIEAYVDDVEGEE